MTVEERLEILKEIAARIKKRKEDFVRGFAEDIGVAVKIGNSEVDITVDYLETMEEELPWVEGRKPYGTVGGILPYDASTMMFARLAGSAIIGGNKVLLSFSSLTPTTRDIMVEELKDLSHLVEINTKYDNRTFGDICCEKKLGVFFISGGRDVGELFEKRIKFFEKIIFAGPSGLPPAVVLSGADAEKAAAFVARRAFLNGGQYCTTIKRVYVRKELFDDFMHVLLDAVDKVKVGDPLDPEVDYGPIKAKRTRVLMERLLKTVKGKVLRGGKIEGEWIYPTVVLAEYIPDLESFGPFLAVKPVESDEEAVKEACDTRYGHIAYVFGDYEPFKGLFEESFGMVHYNPNFVFLPLRGPYGGKKDAGWVLERLSDGSIKKKDGAIIYCQEMTKP